MKSAVLLLGALIALLGAKSTKPEFSPNPFTRKELAAWRVCEAMKRRPEARDRGRVVVKAKKPEVALPRNKQPSVAASPVESPAKAKPVPDGRQLEKKSHTEKSEKVIGYATEETFFEHWPGILVVESEL